MPAIAVLKTMPRGCVSCPFCGDGVFDEISCRLLDYNKSYYELDIKYDVIKKRRNECPLEFIERKHNNEFKHERV